MPERALPTEAEVHSYIRDRRNWGRWGKDDQVGAINLITPAKRAAAARLVRSGRSVSLSRPFPKEPGISNALPAQHYMRTIPRGTGGFAADYYGIFYHGVASTHIDALCHTWDDEAMWNGRDPKREITFDGATFGSARALGRWHHHARCDPRCAAASRRAVRDAGSAGAWLGARRHPERSRHHAPAG